ncbi:hypothetical protein [Streptomyces sp. NBC_00690]|uniref:hypothetical protein n=1 Tax=Streptomyces sp. NBC_00690 TaxID=2975808 RepID=UPI002E2B49E4|nr:hypothetical protein [Streptomyces sp. NBC_00690]
MRTTLATLYTSYSARLAAVAAERLADMGADPVADIDDVMQDVWLRALQLLVLPEPEHAWSVLTGLLDQELAALEASQHRELPCGLDLPGVHWMPPAPLGALPSAVAVYPTVVAA